MKKYLILFIFVNVFLFVNGQTTKEKLISSGTWFLFSSKLEQQDEDDALTQVTFYKKDDTSSLLFDEKNRMYSVFTEQDNEMNEDLWKLLDEHKFVITSMTGDSSQIMEIMEFSSSKLVLRYCDETDSNNISCIITTYFSTKLGWLADTEIDDLNTAGIIEIDEMTP